MFLVPKPEHEIGISLFISQTLIHFDFQTLKINRYRPFNLITVFFWACK